MVKSGENNTSNNIVSEVKKDAEFEKYGITIEKLSLLRDIIVYLTTQIEQTYFGPEYLKTNKDIIDHYCWCCNKTIKQFSELGFQFTTDEALFEFLYVSIYKKEVYELNTDEIDFNYIKSSFNDILDFGKTYNKVQLESAITLYKIFKKLHRS